MSVAGPGLDAGRVAQLRVECYEGDDRRGSGYRVTDTTVLTAAHVIAEARAVQVVFNADLGDEWSVPATVQLCAPAGDVAVLSIDPPEAQREVESARFGRIGRQPAVLACRAVGFPRHKLRTEALPGAAPPPYRDAHQADGTISSLSNWREGTLEITVPPPGRDPDPSVSPWEGMSGAAMWCADRIVGVVSRHHRGDGLGRLAAVCTDRWYEQLDPDEQAQLGELVDLPATSGQLVDVIPGGAAQLVASAYAAYLEDIAPPYLQDREEELAALTGFCAGNEFYGWWQAGPWAGKTALASWFALHPPAGVDVVSFFITRRLAGQADSNAFTEALIEQLTLLTGEPNLPANSPGARDGHRRRLLKTAAEQAAAAGRRLLLVIDGLDEDEGVPPAGASSIAALLPPRPVAGLRVLVTSRPDPGLPHDVPGDHPLQQFQHAGHQPRQLVPSEIGEQLRVLAKTELIEYLHKKKNKLAKQIIGYIAGAGGGLTLTELTELTQASYVDLQARLGSVFGRSMRSRMDTNLPPGQAEPVYLFAHETLRELADEQLGTDLVRYRDRIHEWAESYRQKGWPDTTPRYLGRPYSRLLARVHDLPRLERLVTQPARHDRMLTTTLADAAALAEILDTQQLLLTTSDPDLKALGLLAAERYRLSLRNAALPTSLPALWVRLGQPRRAEQLARSITNDYRQAQALAGVAGALAEAGQPDRAEQLARSITDKYRQGEALAGVARALAEAGQPDRAGQLARSITDDGGLGQALAGVARALAEAGQPDRAEQLARSITDNYITDNYWQVQALIEVARALAAAGQPDRAEQLARSITDEIRQGWALAGVAEALAEAGQPDRAEQLARSFSDENRQGEALVEVARALAGAGQPDRAEQLARSISDENRQGEALAGVARALAGAGQPDRAEQLARSITDDRGQGQALAVVARALAEAGQPDRAEQLARSVIYEPWRTQALAGVARALAGAGQPDRAEQLARSISDENRQGEALVEVARALAEAGQPDRAEQLVMAVEQLARSISDENRQGEALVEVARALAEAGQPDRAEQLAMAVEQLARSISDENRQGQALVEVARALAEAGQPDRAEQLARSITDDRGQGQALAVVARALAEAGQPDRAEQLARSITDNYWQAHALAGVARALAEAGQPDRAEQLARSITDNYWQVQALAGVARALAEAGQPDRAEQLARSITDENWQAHALAGVARALAEAGQPDRAEQLARSITDNYRQVQVQALAGVARALAEAGQPDRAEQLAMAAEQLARSISDENRQAQALIEVARALARRQSDSERSGSRAIVAQLLASSSWHYAVPLLTSLAPAAVVATGEAILAFSVPPR